MPACFGIVKSAAAFAVGREVRYIPSQKSRGERQADV
jgi:hypothetical protein